MKPARINSFVLLLTLLLLLLSSTFAWATEEDTSKKEEDKPEKKVEVIKTIKHVVVIGLDGVSNKDLTNAPNLNSLASMGTKVDNLIPIKPENFSVNMASLLTGLDPSKHGYLNQGDKLSGDTIIDIYQRSNREVLFLDGSAEGLKDLGSLSKVYKDKLTDPKQAIQELESSFPKARPYLTTLFLTIDKKNSLSGVDQEIGRLFSFFHQQGVYDYTLFVVTGIKESEGFAIYTGPGVKGGLLESNSRLVDVFPTMLRVTDGKAPDKVDGLVLWNVFTSGEGYSEQNLLQKRINELSTSQANLTQQLYLAKEAKRKAMLDKVNAEDQKGQVLTTIANKDKEIKTLKLKIGAMKLFGIMMVIGFGIGYIIEYFVLRKKFLMF